MNNKHVSISKLYIFFRLYLPVVRILAVGKSLWFNFNIPKLISKAFLDRQGFNIKSLLAFN